MIQQTTVKYNRKTPTGKSTTIRRIFTIPPHWWYFIIYPAYLQTIKYYLIIIGAYILEVSVFRLITRCFPMDMRHYKEWIKIGLNILYYRKEQRLTQQQLADACGEEGISRAFIQRIETGVSSCSVDTLIDIANALDIPLYKLFEFKD